MTNASLSRMAVNFSSQAIEHRRALHRIPECGLEVPLTNAYIRHALESCGLNPRDCGKGLVADIGNAGPLIALRADTDALPVTEETGHAFASAIPGAMHACGHDAHAGALLASAELAAANPPEGFRLRFIFQPGEEGFFGSCGMIEDGCLEGVSAITGMHAGDLSEELMPGQAGIMAGPMMAASDSFSGSFTGRGGHGSAPHHALDPIPALAQFILAAYTWRSRALDQREPCTVSVCQVASGTAFNIIPETASYMGTVRTLKAETRERAVRELAGLAEHCALMYGLTQSFEWIDGYPPLVNDAAATEAALEAGRRALGADRIVEMTIPCMGGEDFSYYLQKVPGCFWFINTQNPQKGICFPNHNSKFSVDENQLGSMMSLLLATAEALAEKYR